MSDPADHDASMPDVDVSDLEAIRTLARELGFDDDPAVLEDCLATVESLHGRLDAGDVVPGSGAPVGHRSEDEHNALLHVYEEPRVEQDDGPLAGLSVAIKDNLAVKDLPMTGGLRDHSTVPSYDAIVVERLLADGAAIVGKANMDALALGPEGVWSELAQVRNSIDPERVPGGSSSGSAVAVATGLADAALGTDAGGSIRKPAAYNELVGVKPTHGIVPAHGKISCATTLGTIGPIAPSVDVAARVLETIAGPDLRDPGTVPVDLELGVDELDAPLSCDIGVPESFLACADAGPRHSIEALAAAIDDETDCTVRRIELDNGVSSLSSYLSGPEFGWLLRQGAVDHGSGRPTEHAWHDLFRSLRADGLNEHITRRKLPGAYLDAETEGQAYVIAYERMLSFREEFASAFEDVDLVLSPTVPTVPPRLDEDIENLPRNLSINCTPFNLAGAPAVAVPAGRVDGLPVSAQIAASPYEDRLALRGARLLERLDA